MHWQTYHRADLSLRRPINACAAGMMRLKDGRLLTWGDFWSDWTGGHAGVYEMGRRLKRTGKLRAAMSLAGAPGGATAPAGS